MKKLLAIILLMLVLPTERSCALSLEAYIREVWKSSSQLGSRSAQIDMSVNDRWRRFTPNEPQLWFISQDNNGWQQAGLNLLVPFPGRSFLMMGVDSDRESASRHRWAATKLDLAESATQVFLECAAAHQSRAIQQKNVSDLQTFSRTMDKLYERGHSTQAETLAAKLQLRQQESELALSESRLRSVCAKVEAYLPQSRSEVIAPELPDDLSTEFRGELGSEPADVLKAYVSIQEAKAQDSASIWKQLPDITLSAFQNIYYVGGASPVGKPLTYSVQATMTLPLFFLFNEVPETRRERSEATVQRDQGEIALRLARTSQKQAAAEYRRISTRLQELRTEDIPMAEAMMESSFSAYRAGRLGFAELMISRRLYNDLRTQRLQLQVTRIELGLKCLDMCDKDSQ